jgi:superfamily II DNA or RNA helicase
MTRRLQHPAHGQGTVISESGEVLVVEFDGGTILKVLAHETHPIAAPEEALAGAMWGTPLAVGTKLLAHAICSTSDRWGVFSRSRVKLLPHQLWVAHRVLQRWPSRWLIADDVGLGKTIEAGLILSPLLGRKVVQRLLVLAPASLVEQWQTRLREMFDIRSSIYDPDVDRPAADYWNAHRVVVASLHTLRLDHRKRWDRILTAEPWDLVVVDEAHHLNADERGGQTLALELLRKMDQQRLIGGLLLFSGTPHRGKDFGFLSLLSLLDAERFDPRMGLKAALPHLASVVIRNNKGNVTDMRGERLFKPGTVHDRTYGYSPAEQAFYDKLTTFIASGKVFARRMQLGSQRAVMLVLITLQKLAASSVAAVASALRKRLEKLSGPTGPQNRQTELDAAWARLRELDDDLSEAAGLERERLEAQIDEWMDCLQISEDEVPSLRELVEAAAAVERESRLDVLQALISESPAGTTLLIFTEYKVTQALIVSDLRARFGGDSVGFINGDGYLELRDNTGQVTARPTSNRMETAAAFREGRLRFLVSTEAAGEGIDLQNNCHTLVHYDLPWNPMRMHQRVGRLNRFGQMQAVDIYMMRNPATVEGRIWAKLLEKLDRIALTFRSVQTTPEDIHGLVLGAAPPSTLSEMITAAADISITDVESWFDARAATLGGEEVVSAVQALVGHTAGFEFGVDAPAVPKLDLPDLLPFLRAALRASGKRLLESDEGLLAFETPAKWRSPRFFVRDRYERLHVQRHRVGDDAHRLLGTGVQVVEAALATARDEVSTVAATNIAAESLFVFSVSDGVHTEGVAVRSVVLGVVVRSSGIEVIPDWRVVQWLNDLLGKPDRPALSRPDGRASNSDTTRALGVAQRAADDAVPSLSLPFRRPVTRLVGAILP